MNNGRGGVLNTMLQELELITTPAEFMAWKQRQNVQMEITETDAKLLLGYIEGHGYAMGHAADGCLLRVDMESEQVEVDEYSLDDWIDTVCEWNYELILEADANRNNPKNMLDFANEQARYEKYKEDEIVLDRMFEQTKYMAPIEKLAREIAEDILAAYEHGVEKVAEQVADKIRGFQPERVR